MDDDFAKDGSKQLIRKMMAAIILIVLAAIGFSAHLITKTADSPVEQAVEFFIQEETGIPVDFSAELKKEQAATHAEVKIPEATKPD